MTVKRKKPNAAVRAEKAEARAKKLAAEVKHLKEAFGKCVAHLESATDVINSEGVAEDDVPYEREFIYEMKLLLGLEKRKKPDAKRPSASPADRTEGQDSLDDGPPNSDPVGYG